MTKHAKLSASGAERWMNCPGSVALIDSMPGEEISSPYAHEGTVAHRLADWCLKKGETPDNHIGKSIDAVRITGEMADAVSAYIDYIDIHDGKKFYEMRVDYSRFVDGGFGTADCIVIGDGCVDVIDFKYGKGIKVNAVDNPQLMLYALGAFEFIQDIGPGCAHTIGLHIVQPRIITNGEMHIDTHDISRAELDEFAKSVRSAFIATTQACAPLIPGPKQCRWCRAKTICPEIGKHTSDMFDIIE